MKDPIQRVNYFTGLVAIAVILSAAHGLRAEVVPPPTVEASANAHYQGVTPGPDSELVIGSAGGPEIFAEARSYQPGMLGGLALPPFAWDDSDGRARASIGGTLGAYARAGGYSPSTGGGNGTFATATARRVTNWQVEGPSGATTPIDLSVALDGFIYADEYAGTPPASVAAEVSLVINLLTTEGVVNVFTASGRVDLAGDPNYDGYFVTVNDRGGFPWYGAFTPGPLGLSYLVDYAEEFQDIIAVNNQETFAVETILTTTAENDWGPFEVFATSDFYHSGDVRISVDTSGATLVSLNPVPEPSALSIALMAIVIGIRRCRSLCGR